MLKLKRFFCLVCLCAALAVAASGAAADYTIGTGGAGRVTTDPESGDRIVKVVPPPPAVQNQQQFPVYVYPQVGRPGPHPAPSARKSAPSSVGRPAE
jgi:hypothetical protein